MRRTEIMPIYQRIAIDIARSISIGNIEEGSVIYGRSSLAGKYNVSPETIRRALKILEDVEIVKSVKGSGCRVLSKNKAIVFVNKYSYVGNLSKYKNNIMDIMRKMKELEEEAMDNMTKIIDYSSRLQGSALINPLEFVIPENSHLIDKTISELMFWQNTGATIIGVKRKEEVLISPGPYFKFEKDDIVIVIADSNQYTTIEEFIYKH